MKNTTARRLVMMAVALLASLGAMTASALPASAAGSYWQGTVSMNSYYGAASGWVSLDTPQTGLQLNLYYRDVRSDGACAALHVRGVFGNYTRSGWRYAGNNCSTTSNNRAILSTQFGSPLINVEIRMCQSDRYGNVIGSCSAPVAPYRWDRIYY